MAKKAKRTKKVKKKVPALTPAQRDSLPESTAPAEVVATPESPQPVSAPEAGLTHTASAKVEVVEEKVEAPKKMVRVWHGPRDKLGKNIRTGELVGTSKTIQGDVNLHIKFPDEDGVVLVAETKLA